MISQTRPLRPDIITAATDREHLVTVLIGLWMTVGLFLDGYFHQNLETDGESFLTPWHGVFYTGFAAMVFWLTAMARRRGIPDWRLSTLPPGYRAAAAGTGLFALGGIGDALWHTAFGVEKGIDALLSPTHLLLFAGLLALLTSPIRARRSAPGIPPRPWILVWSLVSATALVGFFLNFAWGLGISALTQVAYDPVTEVGETAVIAGVASTLVATAVLFVAAALLWDRDRPPIGATTALFGTVALLVSAAFDEDAEGVAAALVAGVVVDALRRRRLPAALVHAAGAAVLWTTYFGALLVTQGVEWQPEIWAGAIVLNSIAAAGTAMR